MCIVVVVGGVAVWYTKSRSGAAASGKAVQLGAMSGLDNPNPKYVPLVKEHGPEEGGHGWQDVSLRGREQPALGVPVNKGRSDSWNANW